MKPHTIRWAFRWAVLCLAVAWGTGALPARAQEGTPWSSALTKRDVQMRAVTGWDYQPGYAGRTYTGQSSSTTQSASSSQPVDATPVDQIKPSTWDKSPPKPDFVENDPALEPHTKTNANLGFQFGHYSYEEPEPNVTNNALKYGFIGSATAVLYGDWFARVDGRYAIGKSDYKGSGSSKEKTDNILEVRATTGFDVMFGRLGVSPYVGLGYRNLYNDNRGITSTGYYGYRRESQYLFVPVGIEPRYQIDKDSKVSLLIEIDPLLQGWQFSQLTDVASYYPDVHNKQDSGFGLRGEAMYHLRRFSVGPYFNYWKIQNSNYAKCDPDTLMCWVEPKNETLEYGLQFRARLY